MKKTHSRVCSKSGKPNAHSGLPRKNAEQEHERRRKESHDDIKRRVYALFTMEDEYERGRLFEELLNEWCAHEGILVRESFRITGDKDKRTIEQIDGLVEVGGHLYIVEAKWWKSNLRTKRRRSTCHARVYAWRRPRLIYRKSRLHRCRDTRRVSRVDAKGDRTRDDRGAFQRCDRGAFSYSMDRRQGERGNGRAHAVQALPSPIQRRMIIFCVTQRLCPR